MASFDTAGLTCPAQVAWIQDHARVRLALVDGQWIPKVAGRTTHHQAIMGTIGFFLGVTAQTHFDHAGGGYSELLWPFGGLLAINEHAKENSDNRNKDHNWKKTTGRPDHSAR
jgi:hypothetical protein